MGHEHHVHEGGHEHVHGPGCGHVAVVHEGHLDYVHDGHLHSPHGDHVDYLVGDHLHHHHVVCETCGRWVPFHDPELERAIERLGERVDAQISAHDVVLRGTCRDCLKN